ncbi:MAG TPA: hypothetical protein VMM59_02535 [Thermohalobaculum sp.]|nr:hypothetical protein [Thermohalobaculum sp.]
MRRLFKYLFGLALLLAVAFVGYAMFSDLPAPERDKVVELPLPGKAGQGAQ